MKTATILALVALLGVALVPATAQATHNPDHSLWECDDPPDRVLAYILANAVPILMKILGEYVYAYGKTKCTAMEFLGICQDERAPMSTPFPASTGGVHPHRGRCWEYVLIPGGGTIPCPPEQKIEHRVVFGDHTHTCVGILKLA